jgi:hypothetical protein
MNDSIIVEALYLTHPTTHSSQHMLDAETFRRLECLETQLLTASMNVASFSYIDAKSDQLLKSICSCVMLHLDRSIFSRSSTMN